MPSPDLGENVEMAVDRMRMGGAAAAAAGALSLLGRLEIVSNPILRIDFAIVLVFAVSIYFLAVDRRLGLAALGISIVLYLVGAVLPLSVSVALFAAGGLALAGTSLLRTRS